jgi:uncharacterized protein YndB with AHSA1/START domain
MITALVIVGLLVVVIGGAAFFLHMMGRKLPVEHTAFGVITLANTAEEVWDVIADVARHPEWLKGVSKVEKLPDRNGHTVWNQVMGRNSFGLEEVTVERPRRMKREIVDNKKGLFSGSWEFLIIPVPGAAGKSAVKVRLTERGKVHATVPRAIMHMFGEDLYLKKYLAALAGKFGQRANFSHD